MTTLAVATATHCWCGCPVTVSPAPGGQWSARCHDCYDGTDDAGELAHVVGWGPSPDEALWAWADALEEVSKLALTPEGRAALEAFRAGERVPASGKDVVGDLARDVGIEVDRQRGWQLEKVMSFHAALGAAGVLFAPAMQIIDLFEALKRSLERC